MIKDFDAKARAFGILFAAIAALALLQQTRFAFLPAGAGDFLRGVMVGLAIAFAMAYLTNRSAKT
ncbi:MAG: hypothetical protein H0W69_09900 [Gemmatimonadaceae bacterium]|nr:hypothetical protein [Gemmatimonadaceae bacterium]